MIRARRFIFLVTLIFILSGSNFTFSSIEVPKTDDIRPLKGPIDIKERLSIWPIILLILLFVATGVVFLYFKKKKRADEITAVPSKTPEEIATEKLEALIEKQLASSGKMKEYYIRLSDIIREFIEGKYGILALDKTTWELYQDMRSSKKVARSKINKIKDFLEDCDLVKFAKYIPTQKEAEDVYSRAEAIVKIDKNPDVS